MNEDKKYFLDALFELIRFDENNKNRFFSSTNLQYRLIKKPSLITSINWIYVATFLVYLSTRSMPFMFVFSIPGILVLIGIIRSVKRYFERMRLYQKRLHEDEISEGQQYIMEKRKALVKELSEISRQHPEWEVEPWWEYVNGITPDLYAINLQTFAPEIIRKSQLGYYELMEEGSYEIVDRATVVNLISTGRYERAGYAEALPDEHYRFYVLYHVDQTPWFKKEDNTYTRTETRAEVNQRVDAREDKKEMKANSPFPGFYGRTDQEEYDEAKRILGSNYDYGPEIRHDIDRFYQKAMEEPKTIVEGSVDTVYDYSDYGLTECGALIVSESGQPVEVLLTKKQKTLIVSARNYHLMEKTRISRVEVRDTYESAVWGKDEILLNLDLDMLPDLDLFQKRPKDVSLETWAYVTYANFKKHLL